MPAKLRDMMKLYVRLLYRLAAGFPPWGNHFRTQPCVAVRITKTGNMTEAALEDTDCGKTRSFICQSDESDHYIIREEKTWLDARHRCYQNHSILATVRTDSNILTDLQEGLYWVGLSRFQTRWFTGEEMIFHKFDVFPTHLINRCLILGSDKDHWAGGKCDDKYGFVCVKEGDSSTSDISSSHQTTTVLDGTTTRTIVSPSVTTTPNSAEIISEGTRETSSNPQTTDDFQHVQRTSSATGAQIAGIITGITVSLVCLSVFGVAVFLSNKRKTDRPAANMETESIMFSRI